MMDTCVQMLRNSALTTLSHPYRRAGYLIQMGYEPLPPTLGRNMFGRRAYMLPGPLAYVKHIAEVEGGIMGLFRGLAPRLCEEAVGTATTAVLRKCLHQMTPEENAAATDATPDQLRHVLIETTKEMVARASAIIVARPFHVIALKCMVQLAGRETGEECGVLDCVLAVYREQGIPGFFAGVIPRLLASALALWLGVLLAHAVDVYAIDARSDYADELRRTAQVTTESLAGTLTYPLVLVSNLMAVNASGYSSWTDCLRQLYTEGNMFRGLNLSFREASSGN